MKYSALLLLLTSSITLADTDSDLNIAYQIALKSERQVKNMPTLKQSQINWLKFIHTDCIATSYGFYCGNDLSQCEIVFNQCITDYKKSRTEYLKNLTN